MNTLYCPCFNAEMCFTESSGSMDADVLPSGFEPVINLTLRARFTSLITSSRDSTFPCCVIYRCCNCGTSVACVIPDQLSPGNIITAAIPRTGTVPRSVCESVTANMSAPPPWPTTPTAALQFVPALGVVAPVIAGSELSPDPAPCTTPARDMLIREIMAACEERQSDLNRQIRAKLVLYERQLREVAAKTVAREAGFFAAFATRAGLSPAESTQVSVAASALWSPLPLPAPPAPAAPSRTPVPLAVAEEAPASLPTAKSFAGSMLPLSTMSEVRELHEQSLRDWGISTPDVPVTGLTGQSFVDNNHMQSVSSLSNLI